MQLLPQHYLQAYIYTCLNNDNPRKQTFIHSTQCTAAALPMLPWLFLVLKHSADNINSLATVIADACTGVVRLSFYTIGSKMLVNYWMLVAFLSHRFVTHFNIYSAVRLLVFSRCVAAYYLSVYSFLFDVCRMMLFLLPCHTDSRRQQINRQVKNDKNPAPQQTEAAAAASGAASQPERTQWRKITPPVDLLDHTQKQAKRIADRYRKKQYGTRQSYHIIAGEWRLVT